MSALIALLGGDGVGPEVCEQAVRVFEKLGELYGHTFEIRHAAIGGAAIDSADDPLPAATVELCRDADAVLLGAVGHPRFDGHALRPEAGLLRLRSELELFANIRPIRTHEPLTDASPLRAKHLEGVDLVVVRELTGGLYYGERGRDADRAFDTCVYTRNEIARVVRIACEMAGGRRQLVTSVDKANVLDTSRLWRETASAIASDEYPGITLEHGLVDSMAMHLVTRAADFDVIVTENMFGDILSDEAAVLTGSLGMLPSASLGIGQRGLYEPVHGSAPDIAGQGVANPYAAILSVAMLLRHSLALQAEASAVEAAVEAAVGDGFLTRDLGGVTDTATAGSAVLERLSTTAAA